MQLSVSDVARLLQITQETVYRWIEEGKLPAYPVGEHYRFNRSELLEWATAEGLPLSPDAFEDASSDEQTPTLAGALAAGGVFYSLPGRDKRSALRAAVERLELPAGADREALLAVLLARESLGSTGIGDGIAIPHVRNPIILHLSEPTVTLCFLDEPIEFDAVDGRPVDTLFIITSPTIRAHLHLLAHLAFVLQQPELRSVLSDRASADTIIAVVKQLEARLPARARRDGVADGAPGGGRDGDG